MKLQFVFWIFAFVVAFSGSYCAWPLSGGFLVAGLFFLLLCAAFQTLWTPLFNAQFAPIERGQMVRAMRISSGLPMQ